MIRCDGERLGYLAELALGDPVEDLGQQGCPLRRDGLDARFLCHTR